MQIMALAAEEEPRRHFLFSREDSFEVKGARLQRTSTDVLAAMVAAGEDRRMGAMGLYSPFHKLYDSLTERLKKDYRDPGAVLRQHLELRQRLHELGNYEPDPEERSKFNYCEDQIGRWAVAEIKDRVRPLFVAAHDAGQLVDIPVGTFDPEVFARFSRIRLFQAMERFAKNFAFDDMHLERLFIDWVKSQGRKVNQRLLGRSAVNDA